MAYDLVEKSYTENFYAEYIWEDHLLLTDNVQTERNKIWLLCPKLFTQL